MEPGMGMATATKPTEDTKTMCIFTQAGRTYTFKNIYVVTDNESVLVFNYLAMSDGRRKTAVFFKNMFIGYSLWT